MRVLITNSLVLAAISLAPAASAAPYTMASSVDSYDSYPNSTVLAQDSGPSSIPSMLYPYGRTITLSHPTSPLDVRRDDIIQVESLYDASPFGSVFGPVAALFNTMQMNAISDSIPPTETQKDVLDELRKRLQGVADNILGQLRSNLPPSPLSPRSLEDPQMVNPPAALGSLPLENVLDLLSRFGIKPDPASPLNTLPFSHQSRSVEKRPLGEVVSAIEGNSIMATTLSPVLHLITSTGVLDGTSPNDVRELVLSLLPKEIAAVVREIESQTVHIEHTREEHEDWAHHDHHDPHTDDYKSHDHHNKDDHKSQDEHEPQDVHKSQDVHKEGHRSPDVRKEDHDVHGANRGGDRCREQRDGQRDGRNGRDDWKHHKDGKDKSKQSSLLNIDLGRSCRS